MTEPTTQVPASGEKSGFRLLEHLDFLLKRKELLLKVFLISFVLCYLGIYFLVQEQFEATAVIIPRTEDGAGLASNLLSSLKNLPMSLGAKSVRNETDLYKTVIYSRTMMEDVVRKFELLKVYNLDTSDIAHMEKAIKRLRDEVQTKESEESAFLITARAVTRQQAADMTNYIVRKMNDRIVELKAGSSRETRIFMEKRVGEIAQQLKAAEDSLRTYQERTGMLDAKVQLQGILTAHASLETELTAKQLQKGILERVFDKQSPQVRDLDIQIQEYQKKLEQLRAQGYEGGPLIALNKLPKTAVEFVRRYREVEINNLLMQYIVPMYEQAKIEEKKDYPILQVVDYAIPPAKKSWPPRTIFALLGAFSITLFVYLYFFLRHAILNSADSRLLAILRDTQHWTWKSEKR